jgi:O-antigen ligase
MMFWFVTLFAVATLASQSAMDLFATLFCLAVIFKILKRVRAGESLRSCLRPVGLEKLFLVWLIVIGLSFAFSPLSNTDWLARLLEFRWIFIFYCLAWALCEIGIRPKAQVAASIVLGLCSLYAIVVYFLGFDPINPNYNLAPWSGGHRTGGLLSNAMTFAHVYGMYFCLLVGPTLLALHWKSPDLKFLLPALVLTGVALILSFTRGVWIAMAGATLVMAFVYNWRFGSLMTVLGGAGLWLATAFWPTLAERLSVAATSGDERQWIWRGHYKIFMDHPILGVGYGENTRMIPDYYRMIGAPTGTIESHAHNQYLHFLAGTGVIGLVMYLLVLGAVFLLTIRTYRRISDREPFARGLILGCIGAQIAFFLGGLTEANFEHSKVKFVMILIWSLVVWQANETRVLKERSA